MWCIGSVVTSRRNWSSSVCTALCELKHLISAWEMFVLHSEHLSWCYHIFSVLPGLFSYFVSRIYILSLLMLQPCKVTLFKIDFWCVSGRMLKALLQAKFRMQPNFHKLSWKTYVGAAPERISQVIWTDWTGKGQMTSPCCRLSHSPPCTAAGMPEQKGCIANLQ